MNKVLKSGGPSSSLLEEKQLTPSENHNIVTPNPAAYNIEHLYLMMMRNNENIF